VQVCLIIYSDTNGNDVFSGDEETIYEVVKSKPEIIYYINDDPIITKVRPRSCLPGDKIRIIGSGFGDRSPFSALHISPRTYLPYPTNPKIPLWTDTKIIVSIPFKNKPCQWFKQGDGEYRKRKVWVTVGDGNLVDSNTKKFKVLKPGTCP
jgi:hypothetical protein